MTPVFYFSISPRGHPSTKHARYLITAYNRSTQGRVFYFPCHLVVHFFPLENWEGTLFGHQNPSFQVDGTLFRREYFIRRGGELILGGFNFVRKM